MTPNGMMLVYRHKDTLTTENDKNSISVVYVDTKYGHVCL